MAINLQMKTKIFLGTLFLILVCVLIMSIVYSNAIYRSHEQDHRFAMRNVLQTLMGSLDLESQRSSETNFEVYSKRSGISKRLAEIIKDTSHGDMGYVFACDQEGIFAVHPDEGLEGASLQEAGLSRDILQKDEFVVYDFQGEERIAYIDLHEPTGLYLGLTMPHAEFQTGAFKQVAIAGLKSVLPALAAAALVAFFLNRMIMSPIRELALFSEEAAKGNRDYEFKYRARDAVGRTLRRMEEMVRDLTVKEGFAESVVQGIALPCLVCDEQGRLHHVNQALLKLLRKQGSPSEHISQQVNEFLGDYPEVREPCSKIMQSKSSILRQELELKPSGGDKLYIRLDGAPLLDKDENLLGCMLLMVDLTENKEQEQKIRVKNQELSKVAQEAGQISERLSSASQELSSQVDETTKGAEEQKDRASEVASAIEQMNSSIHEIARNASDVAKQAEDAKKRAKEGAQEVEKGVEIINQVHEQASKLQSDMSEMGSHVEGISNIMNTISDIADQTNLLALNAAIEAARAGESGKGFAVVADEVRKLAEKTMQATQEVEQHIQNIQTSAQTNIQNTQKATQSINDSTELINKSGRLLQDIVQVVEKTSDQVQGIASASEEQSTASEQVTQSSEQVKNISSEISTAMNEASQAVEDLSRQAQNLHELMKGLQKA